jgi:hypothetical protein
LAVRDGENSIFRFASITKPITAAAVMILVEDGRLALHDPWIAGSRNSTIQSSSVPQLARSTMWFR